MTMEVVQMKYARCGKHVSAQFGGAMFLCRCDCKWEHIIDGGEFMEEASGGQGEAFSPGFRVARIVADVKRRGGWHDYQDVVEYGTDEILAWYGWDLGLIEQERESLRRFLLRTSTPV